MFSIFPVIYIFGRFVSVVSFRFGRFVSVVSAVSFRSFRFDVLPFSTCQEFSEKKFSKPHTCKNVAERTKIGSRTAGGLSILVLPREY